MSLKTVLRQRLVNDMILSSRNHSGSSALALVLDINTSRILSSSMRMYDTMEHGIVVVQNISLQRETLIDIPAIYFIQPTMQNIETLNKDFTSNKKQYKSAYLYFTSRVKPDLLQLISNNTTLVQYIQQFVELNIDWLALESNVFTFNRTLDISNIYYPSSQDVLATELNTTARQLVSLCLTLNEYPLVRYSTLGKGSICKALAQFYEDEMKKTVTRLTSWRASESRDRGTLLILDRSIDITAALVHGITYQSMVNDLLRVKGELCYMPEQNSRYIHSSVSVNQQPSYILSDDDTLWLQLRHQHISNVITTLTKTFREFKSKNQTAQFAAQNANNTSNVRDMIRVMNDMPEYKQMVNMYSKHFSISETTYNRFNNKKLRYIAELEQDIVTGLSEQGDKVSQKKVKEMLVQYCTDNDIGRVEKLRLIILYIVVYGQLDDTLKQQVLVDIPNQLQQCLIHINRLQSSTDNNTTQQRARQQYASSLTGQHELMLQRYIPYIQTVMSQISQHTLDEALYPYNSPPPEGYMARSHQQNRRQRHDWKDNTTNGTTNGANNITTSTSNSNIDDDRPYIIVYVLGGITYEEIRTAYQVADSSDVNLIIGSTNTITGNEFVRQLCNVNSNAFKTSLMSNKNTDVDDEIESGDQFTNFDQISIDMPASTGARFQR